MPRESFFRRLGQAVTLSFVAAAATQLLCYGVSAAWAQKPALLFDAEVWTLDLTILIVLGVFAAASKRIVLVGLIEILLLNLTIARISQMRLSNIPKEFLFGDAWICEYILALFLFSIWKARIFKRKVSTPEATRDQLEPTPVKPTKTTDSSAITKTRSLSPG